MSDVLLNRVSSHIVTDGSLLPGYQVKYYRWSDRDLKGSADVALFRMSGTSGPSDPEAQQHDVSLSLLVGADQVRAADSHMLSVLRYLRDDFETEGVFAMSPLGAYTGPSYLENDRAIFEMVIRCGTEDH
jgi:hypothetical protein